MAVTLSQVVRVNKQTILRNMRWAEGWLAKGLHGGRTPEQFQQDRREYLRDIGQHNVECDISVEEAMRRIFG